MGNMYSEMMNVFDTVYTLLLSAHFKIASSILYLECKEALFRNKCSYIIV